MLHKKAKKSIIEKVFRCLRWKQWNVVFCLFGHILINLFINIRTGSADKDTPYDPRDPRPDWPYQPIDQSTSPPSRPEQYRAAVGDRTKMSCEIENRNARTSWRRQDGGPLPRNAFLSGGDLIIEYVQEDAAGVYECVVHEPTGDYPIITTELVIVGKY